MSRNWTESDYGCRRQEFESLRGAILLRFPQLEEITARHTGSRVGFGQKLNVPHFTPNAKRDRRLVNRSGLDTPPGPTVRDRVVLNGGDRKSVV